jgi:hypothetical protein
MKSDKVGTTLKHPKTINGNVKVGNLSFLSFYFENLTLPLIVGIFGQTYSKTTIMVQCV